MIFALNLFDPEEKLLVIFWPYLWLLQNNMPEHPALLKIYLTARHSALLQSPVPEEEREKLKLPPQGCMPSVCHLAETLQPWLCTLDP